MMWVSPLGMHCYSAGVQGAITAAASSTGDVPRNQRRPHTYWELVICLVLPFRKGTVCLYNQEMFLETQIHQSASKDKLSTQPWQVMASSSEMEPWLCFTALSQALPEQAARRPDAEPQQRPAMLWRDITVQVLPSPACFLSLPLILQIVFAPDARGVP